MSASVRGANNPSLTVDPRYLLNQDVTIPVNDTMDIDNETSGSQLQMYGSSLQIQSLLLASFPWSTSLPMAPTQISKELGNNHYASLLAHSVDIYDAFLQKQNIHSSPLKAILRDVGSDTMVGLSSTAISKRETKILKTKEKSNELCSLLCAYRLLDVIASFEVTNQALTPPSHKKMSIDFTKNAKALRVLEDWPLVLEKFRHNFSMRKKQTPLDAAGTDLPTKHLHALFRLHSNMAADKSLFNMQLAVTHISFMLQYKSEDIRIPDFPGTLQEFKDIAALTLSDSNNGQDEKFVLFLEKIARDKQNINNLHLPLQVALLISPIFLLQEIQIHLSTFYVQRYKPTLYSKALGNGRPDIISKFEQFMWKELFSVAKGQQTIEDAATNIVEFIPDHFNDIGSDIRNWFSLKPSDNHNFAVHMSSLSIQDGSVPSRWPLASMLAPERATTSPDPSSSQEPTNDTQESQPLDIISVENTEDATMTDINMLDPSSEDDEPIDNNINDNSGSEIDRPKGNARRKHPTRKSTNSVTAPSLFSVATTRSTRKKRKNKGRSTSTTKTSSSFRSFKVNEKTISNAARHLPLIVGKTYLKVEDINLEDLLVTFL
ncbi:hypothetical protein BYT27DRAFT_7207231 [Phlegmacium glaucopus]|nr:hypothetical protein BYT27DRAFT_7207231 [Phlegmacium glaucopus]